MDMKNPLVILLCVLHVVASQAQFITSTLVESWSTPKIPSEDFHLNSSYLFLLNPHALKETFEGQDLEPGERREIGIKKTDLPRYMYLAVSIPNPLKEDDHFTIPLMIQDMRNPNQVSRVTGYGGRVLENIPDEALKSGDIIAKVKIETIRDNNSTDFWKKTAQISLDLGKTASSLLANPITGSLFLLTQQIIPQVSKGISSLQESEQPDKVTSEFFIPLMDKEFVPGYSEKVVSANLYKIHWDGRPAPRTRFLRRDSFENVQEVKSRITSAKTPYILVVQTKSEFVPDHNSLEISSSYISKCKSDFSKIYNDQKKVQEREFIAVLEKSLILKDELLTFRKSLNTRFIHWTAFARALDFYLHIGQYHASFEGNYKKWFNQMLHEIDGWFDDPLLAQGQSVVQMITTSKFNHLSLYEKIKILDFYRSRLDLIKVGDRLPEEIEAMDITSGVQIELFKLEQELFEKEFSTPIQGWSEQKKIDWLSERKDNYFPRCLYCLKAAEDEIAKIKTSFDRENQKKYRALTAQYYRQIICLEEFQSLLKKFIFSQQIESTLPESVLEGIQADQKNLEIYISEWKRLISRDPMELSGEDLKYTLLATKEIHLKMEGIGVKLRNTFPEGDLSCIFSEQP